MGEELAYTIPPPLSVLCNCKPILVVQKVCGRSGQVRSVYIYFSLMEPLVVTSLCSLPGPAQPSFMPVWVSAKGVSCATILTGGPYYPDLSQWDLEQAEPALPNGALSQPDEHLN